MTEPSTQHPREGRGYLYRVWDSEIYVRNRPRSLSISERKDGEIVPEDLADAYLSVTDTWCVGPPGVPFTWIPWNEDRYPTADLFYGVNKTLIWWTHYMKLKRIQVFCDGGTHRSVTVFGAFLMTYFQRPDYEKIVRERVPVNQEEMTQKGLVDSICQPIEYIEGYLDKFPQDRLLFAAMRSNYMGRLDDHCRQIYRSVAERYGRKNVDTA